jgi:UDPglucose 6-dehydrogenase
MIAVQTPGEFGTAFVEEAARETGRRLRSETTVVLRSTAPLGTTRRAAEIIAGQRGKTVRAASNPEFLVEGKAYEAFMQPDRIVVGVEDEDTADLMRRLYAAIDAPLIITDVATAELAKYAANAYLATQISFINEIADIAAAAGADINDVSRIIKMDSRVGDRAYLNAGIGFGGSCLPKDLRTLTRSAENLGVEVPVARAVNEVNERRADRAVEQLQSAIGDIEGTKIAVWGLAFKGGTNDVRESPAINVVRRLLSLGAAVRAYDPLAEPNAAPLVGAAILCDGLCEPLADADALMVLTDCKEFATADLAVVREQMRGRVIVDGRGVIAGEAARAAGFTYLGVGDRA